MLSVKFLISIWKQTTSYESKDTRYRILIANCKWAALQRINYVAVYLTFWLYMAKFHLHNLHWLNFLNFSTNFEHAFQQEILPAVSSTNKKIYWVKVQKISETLANIKTNISCNPTKKNNDKTEKTRKKCHQQSFHSDICTSN